jgi:N utilization substance protein B
MPNKEKISSPRIKVIQKLYSNSLNDGTERSYNKSQYKKFIKDVVEGTIERSELIEETIAKFLSDDLDSKRTDKLIKIILHAAVFELLYKHATPTKVIISEYIKSAEYFLEKAQIKYLNAIIDKIAKNIRNLNT